MRQIRYTKPGIALMEAPEPELAAPTDVKIKVAYASLCGSDLHILRGDFDAFLTPELCAIGHEAAGTIVDVGTAAGEHGLSIGDTVTFYFNRFCAACRYCRNGQEQFCSQVRISTGFMSDYVVLDERQVYRLQAGVNLADAALIEPMTVAMRGIDLCRIRPGMTVAVFGGGGIGQLAARLAQLSGAAALTLIEPTAAKRAVAAAGGANHVLDPATDDIAGACAEITGGIGFDVVIDTSGAPSACRTAMDIVGRGGLVEFLGTYPPAFVLDVPMGLAFMREVTVVTGVFQSPYMFPRGIELHARLGLSDLVTGYLPADCAGAVDDQRSGDTVKALFDFSS